MRNSRTQLMTAIVFLAAVLVLLNGSSARAQGQCTQFKGTIVATLQPYQNGLAWVGHAYFTLGKDDRVYEAELVDLNDGHKAHPSPKEDLSGNFAGSENLIFTVDESNWFRVHAQFVVVEGSSPYLYQLNETGKIVEGGGMFAGATGQFSIHGPATVNLLGGPDFPFYWIAEITGTICR